MRRAGSELWAILGIWWLLIPGGIGAAIATVQLVEGIHHKPLWFWTTWVMTGFAVASFVRSIRVSRERDAALAAVADEDASLKDWLARQIDELRGLLRRLEEVLAATPFDPDKAHAVQGHLWEIVRDVDRRLHTSAPEWVDYFNKDHARYPVELAFPKADLYANQLVPAIESTIDQIAHIQARL